MVEAELLLWENTRAWKYRVKSLYNFKNLLQRQMKRQMRWILLQSETYIFKFYLPYLYMGTISCTKHMKTIFGFFWSMFSSDVPGCPLLPLSNTVPVSINFSCHPRIDGRDDGSLPYLVLKFRESADPIWFQQTMIRTVPSIEEQPFRKGFI